MPKRIRRQRAKDWRMPSGCLYVGRPTLWGNPFICDDPEVAVDAYQRLLGGGTQTFSMGGRGGLQFARNANPRTLHRAWADWARESIARLRGHDLCCWCALDQPCHVDVLLDAANS